MLKIIFIVLRRGISVVSISSSARGTRQGSPDGDFQPALGASCKTKVDRLDPRGYKATSDPRAKGPHGHRPGVTTPDGSPYLSVHH